MYEVTSILIIYTEINNNIQKADDEDHCYDKYYGKDNKNKTKTNKKIK